MSRAQTWATTIGESSLVLTIEEDGEGKPVRVSCDIGKLGNVAGLLVSAICQAVSIGLRNGVSVEAYAHGLGLQSFRPSGKTSDPEVPTCTSPVDYIARRLALSYGRAQ